MYSDSILLLIDQCDFYKVRWMSALGLFETFNKFLFFFKFLFRRKSLKTPSWTTNCEKRVGR